MELFKFIELITIYYHHILRIYYNRILFYFKERSVVLATYACCGFGSIAAVGIYVGALISVAPERRGDISEVALRAVINGNLASFLTATIAGLL